MIIGDPTGWTEYVNAFSTLAIAVFTILLFFAVIWQTKTTRNLERAWILDAQNIYRQSALPERNTNT
jgi:hypothetical protein